MRRDRKRTLRRFAAGQVVEPPDTGQLTYVVAVDEAGRCGQDLRRDLRERAGLADRGRRARAGRGVLDLTRSATLARIHR